MRALLLGLSLAGVARRRSGGARRTPRRGLSARRSRDRSPTSITTWRRMGRVLFRLFAPQAHVVSLFFGNTPTRLDRPTPQPMTKAEGRPLEASPSARSSPQSL